MSCPCPHTSRLGSTALRKVIAGQQKQNRPAADGRATAAAAPGLPALRRVGRRDPSSLEEPHRDQHRPPVDFVTNLTAPWLMGKRCDHRAICRPHNSISQSPPRQNNGMAGRGCGGWTCETREGTHPEWTGRTRRLTLVDGSFVECIDLEKDLRQRQIIPHQVELSSIVKETGELSRSTQPRIGHLHARVGRRDGRQGKPPRLATCPARWVAGARHGSPPLASPHLAALPIASKPSVCGRALLGCAGAQMDPPITTPLITIDDRRSGEGGSEAARRRLGAPPPS